ncbi:flavin reductase family protein [Neoroseomonas lacus]|uniref:Flavin reductase n=1 Tax=Neoroseomonas lacus TaxID=287609 RepID=A0A917NIQ2_9PROT|nr:flavin reductase family protein [Neoroseomonas lacus]GGJ03830.1 flavin reductase [Neoroseomonas lacus]
MRTLPLDRVYQLIEPGPVVLVATSQRGTPNVMTMSWHMMVEFTPPQIACIVSNRNHSFTALRRIKECVIAIPPAAFAKTVVAIGNCSGADTDKFATLGIATRPARHVEAPLLPDCFANLECRVVDTRMVSAYCMFVLEVVHAWIDPERRDAKTIHHQGWGRFAVDGRTIRLASDKA